MADTSSIEWTEATINPWTGCTKVSPGCANCYIERTPPFRVAGRRFERGDIPLVFHMERLEKIVRRRKPTMYFVNSLSDVFHEDVPDVAIGELWAAMACSPQHTFQILTKRPERMQPLLSAVQRPGENIDVVRDFIHGFGSRSFNALMPLPNVWLGVSIENRRFVDRVDPLRDTPAAVRFISAEPLLGPLVCDARYDTWKDWQDGYVGRELSLCGIDWLIVGGESGPGFRRLDPEWMRHLKTEAFLTNTAFFVKQMGGLRPGSALEDLPEDLRIREMPGVGARG